MIVDLSYLVTGDLPAADASHRQLDLDLAIPCSNAGE